MPLYTRGCDIHVYISDIKISCFINFIIKLELLYDVVYDVWME